MNNEIKNIIKAISPVCRKYGIHSASLVGSVARGEQTAESDLDIVVEIDQPISLLTFASIKIELEDILQRKVDLIERSAIKPLLKKYLLKDEVVISL
jgi:uncharacterized protein